MNNDGQSIQGTNIIKKNTLNDITSHNVPPSPALLLQPDEDETVSVDISVPSTYSTLPPKKKQQLSMANLYVERIFRGFRKNFGQPTISSGKFEYLIVLNDDLLIQSQLLLIWISFI